LIQSFILGLKVVPVQVEHSLKNKKQNKQTEKEDQEKKETTAKKAAKEAQQGERTAFEISILDTFIAFCNLKVFYAKALQGKYSDLDSDGKPKESKEIARQKQNLGTIINQITKMETKHLEDGTYADGNKFVKGDIKRKPVEQVSDIIPLKFNAQMDGIGGIIIGNVFKINPSRLPAAYRKTEGRQILFITMAEDQKITSGQDWTTNISGQLTIIASDVNEQATGTKIRKEGTGGNGGGSGQAGSVVESKEAKYEDNSKEESKVETKTPAQEQIEQQDQCPEGQYFDEELQACVLEEAVVEEKVLVGNTGLTQDEIDAGKLESTRRGVSGPPPYNYAYLYQSAKNPQNGAITEEFFKGNEAKVNTINQKLDELLNLYGSRYQYNFSISDFPGLDNENVGAAYSSYETWITALYEDFPELRTAPPPPNIVETYRSLPIELTTWGAYRADPTEENGQDIFGKLAAAAGVAYNDSVYESIEFELGGSSGEYDELGDMKMYIDDAIEDWEDDNGTSAGLGERTT